jgi:hypothetical protein
VWPVRPRPLPDELLTSWLSRVALANGTDLGTLLRSVGVSGRGWLADLDYHAPHALITQLATQAGVSKRCIEASTLRDACGRILGRHQHRSRSAWLLAHDEGVSSLARYGFQYCRRCLAADGTPYLRRHWRFGFVSCCRVHRCYLSSRCGACRRPVAYRRLTGREESLVVCTWCGKTIAMRGSRRLTVPTPSVTETQGRLLLASEGPTVELADGTSISTADYFRVLHSLVVFFLSGRGRSLRSCAARQALGPHALALSRGASLPLRTLPPQIRGPLVELGVFLLDEWPRRFEDDFVLARCWSTNVRKSFGRCPPWFASALTTRLTTHSASGRRRVVEFLR